MAKKEISDSSEKNDAFIQPFGSLLNPLKRVLDIFPDSKTVEGADVTSSTEPPPVPPETIQQEDFLSIPQLKEKADALVEAAENLADALDHLMFPAFYLDGNTESVGITIAGGQCLVVYSGSTARETTVGKGGELIVRDGATAEYITLARGAKLTVRKGGNALNVVNAGGEIIAEKESIVTFATPKRKPLRITKMMLETSPLYLEKNVRGIDLTVAKDQKLIVCSGNMALNTTVEKGGEIIIRDGAEGNGIILNGGKLSVRKGGRAVDVLVNAGGVVDAEENAFVTYVVTDLGKEKKTSLSPFYLEKNRKGVDITVAKDRKLIVCGGSIATNTTVKKGGEIIIRNGAEGNGIILKGGKLTVRKGGIALDVVNDGGIIDAAEGAVVAFAAAPAEKPAKETKKAAPAKKPVKKAEAKKTAKPKKDSKA